jgi:methyltransferase (TIGR00027 family)
LVKLGAGYDSRAYRFDLHQVKTFEVDHPATQQDKLEKVKAIFGESPRHVCYVPVDFNTKSAADRLLQFGFDPTLKTIFIWQGVSMYLTAQAVDNTLSFAMQCSGNESAVVFDFIYQEVLEAARQKEVNNMRRYRFMILLVLWGRQGQETVFY